jgi:glycosyltransferase involved in cell wall biosynthesis/SAM-dependent methyltransferase
VRVLVTLAYYRPHWTGLTMLAARLAEGMAARGHEVTVLAARHARDLPPEEELDGVRVVRVPTVGRLSRTMVMPGYPRRLARLAAEHDVIHLHTPMAEAAVVAAVARARRRPLLVTHQGDVVMPPGVVNRVVQASMDLTLRRALRAADEVLTLSDDYARSSTFLRSLGRPVGAVHPPVEIPVPDPAGVARRRAQLAPDGGPVIGFGGRFVAEKGFDVLLRAVPEVVDAVPAARFAFAGETNVAYEDLYGRCRPLLQAAAPHLTEVGLLLDRQELADFYAACDVFVVPSRSDCFAAVQIEALRCGTPLLTSDIPGAREVVQQTGAGRLVAPEDPSALAAAIVDAVAGAGLPGPSASDLDRHFDPTDAIDRYEAVLTRLARTAGRRSVTEESAAPAEPVAPASVLDRLLDGEADMAYRRRARWMVDRLDLHDGQRVLDAGCGLGSHLHLLRSMYQQLDLIGVDLDAERLTRAREVLPGVPLALAALGALPVPDAAVDRVLASEVLEHLVDDEGALHELHRVLRPGGVLVASVPHADYPFWWDPVNGTLERLGRPPLRHGPLAGIWTDHERLYRPDGLRRLVERAGFEVEEVEEQTHHVLAFSHQLVYGLGVRLLERGLVSTSTRERSGRFGDPDVDPGRGAGRGPVAAGLALMRRIDARNDRRERPARTHVSIVLRAVKR